MRKFKNFALTLAICVGLSGCAAGGDSATTAIATTTQTTVATVEASTEASTEVSGSADIEKTTASEEITGGFHVEGTKLLDAKGNEFVMRGINAAHSWYASEDGTTLKALAEMGCNSVRLVCGSGQDYTKDSATTLNTLIRVAKNLNMVVILEAHDGTGKNDFESLEQIVNYWIEVKDALIGNEAYVILNIANEWYGNWNKLDVWAESYETLIPRLREAGIKNTIMVDSAGWGQYSQSLADYGAEIFASDPEANTMFAIHMYGTAGKNAKTIEKGLKGVTNQNLCVCVGEFGYKHSDGDVDEAYIMQYCEENNIGYLAWSWKGNSGGVEYLDLAESWDGSVLSSEWGEVVINGEYGIKATSKLCSIYE